MAEEQFANREDSRLRYIIPVTLLALIVGFLLKNVLIGLLIFALAAYHLVRYIIERKDYMDNKKAIKEMIERGDVAVSVETLSHIAEETVYEPNRVVQRDRVIKTVKRYCFASGASWRVSRVDRHYGWSRECFISTKGLENISISGDEFFYISLQENHEIAYIYPCKSFELEKLS